MIEVDVKGVGKVKFPDTYTPEQIEQAIERDILPQAKPVASTEREPVELPMMARVGRGAQDVLDRISQVAIAGGEKVGLVEPGISDIATQQMNEERAMYERDRKAQGGGKIDVARMVGNIGMQSPLMLIPGGKSFAGRAALGAVQGGASGAIQYDPTNTLKQSLKNTGVGAGVGAVVAPIAGAITDKTGDLVRRLFGRAKGVGAQLSGDATEETIKKAVPEIERLPPNAQADLISEAQQQIRKTGSLSTEQLVRKANLLANDVTPTKSMVTRDPSDWALERNLQKLGQSPDEQLSNVGRELTDVYQRNDAALANKLYGLSENLPKATQEGHGMTVMQSLDDLAKASQAEVSKIYEQVRTTAGDNLASDARKLVDALDDLRDSPAADQITEAATRRLKRLGMIDASGSLTAKTLTVKEAEGLRQFINQQPNAFGKRQVIAAIDADVLSGLGDDAFAPARKAATERFATLDNPATQKALNALDELSQGKTAQSFVKSQLIDAPAQDVKALVDTLGKITDPAKRQEALDAMKAGVLSYLQSKAINPNSNQFSGAALNKAIETIGDEKLVLTLGKEGAAQLKSLTKAALDATYQPAYSAVNASNTAPMLMSLMQKARTVPGVPLIVTDEAQRIAARAGYQKQLADALLAKSESGLPQLPLRAQQVGKALSQLGVPASQAALDQARKPPDKKTKNR